MAGLCQSRLWPGWCGHICFLLCGFMCGQQRMISSLLFRWHTSLVFIWCAFCYQVDEAGLLIRPRDPALGLQMHITVPDFLILVWDLLHPCCLQHCISWSVSATLVCPHTLTQWEPYSKQGWGARKGNSLKDASLPHSLVKESEPHTSLSLGARLDRCWLKSRLWKRWCQILWGV